ncbi:MAG TPA: lysophospholipid acyltransferase family protein [Vicinamibacterales bacterium]
MAGIETALRTVLAIAVLPLTILAASVVSLLLAVGGLPATRGHWIYVGCARLCLWIGGTRLDVQDADRIDSQRTYVVVPNHESNWDSPCVTAGLTQLTLRFVVKREVMRIPIFGQALRLTGNVSVVRSDTEKDVREIWRAMHRRLPGISVVFFAEGTRSPDGALHPFKLGAFATAVGLGLPILPVGIAGTYAIWPKGTFRLRRGSVIMKIGEPIPTEGLTYADHTDLRDRTYESVARLRAEARASLLEGHSSEE